jgi:ribosomal protein S18 acetylase RimI-like enzyme
MTAVAEAIPEARQVSGLTIRYTVPQDAEWLKKWLLDPSVKNSFPMLSEGEVDDAVRRWISFSRIRASLTVEMDGRPVGLATLYVQAYKRLVHQTEFGIIVDPDYRGKGVGSFLLSSIMKLAKQHFHVELIHLQVYQDNPAIFLYEKFGFKEFGRQTHWIKEGEGQYVGRIFMERSI